MTKELLAESAVIVNMSTRLVNSFIYMVRAEVILTGIRAIPRAMQVSAAS